MAETKESVRGGSGLLEPASSAAPGRLFSVDAVRRDFPILGTMVRGRPLVYLDNAATSQKPQAVIDAISGFYATGNANIHRGVYALSEQATVAYDQARRRVARFLGAASPAEIVFTRGTTESINLVAQSWGRAQLRRGDEILVTAMEHHSNLIPWQLVAEQTGAVLRAAPITQQGELDLDAWHRLLERPDPARRRHPHLERAGHAEPGARARRGCPCAGRGGPGGRGAVGSPSPDRRQCAGLRLLRLLGAQAVRADRGGGAVRPGGAAGTDAAVAGRGRDDRERDAGALHLGRASRPGSKPVLRRSPRRSGSRSRWTTWTGSASRQSPPGKTPCSTALWSWSVLPRGSAWSAPRRDGPPCSPSSWMVSIPMTWARYSTTRESRFGPATIAPSR